MLPLTKATIFFLYHPPFVGVVPFPTSIYIPFADMTKLNLLISIDDTDNLDSPGSGTAAELLAAALEAEGLANCADISRHQLFVHKDIPYTSHNSAMCFPASARTDDLEAIIHFGRDFLRREAAAGSDPGLCVMQNDSPLDQESLIAFGHDAKKRILTKDAAYQLARHLHIHLSEHGGSGIGVIGALAAIGLRLSGNDGRFRGWHRLGAAGTCTTVGQLCSYPFIDAVLADTGERLPDHTPLLFAEDTVKTTLLQGMRVVPVTSTERQQLECSWTTLGKRQMKNY